MLSFFIIWLILNVVALWLISLRLDHAVCYSDILDFIITDNILVSLINFVFTIIILPLTIPKNIINLFK